MRRRWQCTIRTLPTAGARLRAPSEASPWTRSKSTTTISCMMSCSSIPEGFRSQTTQIDQRSSSCVTLTLCVASAFPGYFCSKASFSLSRYILSLISLSLSLFFFVYLPTFISLFLVSLSLCMSVPRPPSLSLYLFFFVSQPLCTSVSRPLSLSLFFSVSLSTYLSFSLYHSLYLPLPLYVYQARR